MWPCGLFHIIRNHIVLLLLLLQFKFSECDICALQEIILCYNFTTKLDRFQADYTQTNEA